MGWRADAYRRATDLNPKDYRAWYGLGQTYELLQMPYYALHYFRRATQLRPHDARMWCVSAESSFWLMSPQSFLRRLDEWRQ